MRPITTAQEDQLANSLAELARARFDEGKDRKAALTFSNNDIARVFPMEWYDAEEHPELTKAAKARIRGQARLIFGDYGKHGGARKGAGRKPKHEADKSVNSSITMPIKLWAKLDRLRGTESRSRFLQRKIQAMREGTKKND